MKIFQRGFALLTIAILSYVQVHASPLATNQPTGFRLTIELQDGSRIIGKSRDDSFKFHSDVLGDMDLSLEKIRAVESVGKTNVVKLTTASADSLSVEFAMKNVHVETAFGDVKLPVAAIKSVRVAAIGKAGRPTDGLIGLWSGEGNGVDSVGGNNGVLQNVSFTDGVAGQAFTLSPNSFPYGTWVGVRIPDHPAFALTQSLTIEGWIRPRGNGYYIFSRGDRRPGFDPYGLSMQANHDLRFIISDNDNASAAVDANIPYYEWTHVAATLDGDTGTMSLYTNGVLASQMHTDVRPIGDLISEMSPGVCIGNMNDGFNNFPFAGDVDEISLYNRALSADEINAIYNVNSGNAHGRAEPLPTQNPDVRMRFGNQYPEQNSD